MMNADRIKELADAALAIAISGHAEIAALRDAAIASAAVPVATQASNLGAEIAWSNDPQWRAQRLAEFFHDTYERLAPSFGYETRADTKRWTRASQNGRLMTAVCAEVLAALHQAGAQEPAQPVAQAPLIWCLLRGNGTFHQECASEAEALESAAVLTKRHGLPYTAAALYLAAPAAPPGWLEALRFYANGEHMILSDDTAWDSVSGEPENWQCDEAGTATVEDGSFAAMALRGEPIPWADSEGDSTPAPIAGERLLKPAPIAGERLAASPAPVAPDVVTDAQRYRWLRQQNWFDSALCVLRDPKQVLTRGSGLGADCPSLNRLDAAIDDAIAASCAAHVKGDAHE